MSGKFSMNDPILFFAFLHSFIERPSASGFILSFFTEHYLRIIVRQPEGKRCKLTCLSTNCVDLRNKFSDREKIRHRSKRFAFIVHVKPSDNNAFPVIGECIANFHDRLIKKLSLINTHDVTIACQKKYI